MKLYTPDNFLKQEESTLRKRQRAELGQGCCKLVSAVNIIEESVSLDSRVIRHGDKSETKESIVQEKANR